MLQTLILPLIPNGQPRAYSPRELSVLSAFILREDICAATLCGTEEVDGLAADEAVCTT